MRRLFLLFALVPLMFFAKSEHVTLFGKYSFSVFDTFENYQQYIGKTVVFLPSKDSELKATEDKLHGTQELIPEQEYVILNISPKSGHISTTDDLKITLQEKNGKKKVKMKCWARVIYMVPLLFIDDFNNEKDSYIGTEFTDPLVKGSYKITDVKLEDSNVHAKYIAYYVSNSAINRSFKTGLVEDKVKEFIEEDKETTYHTTLVKVEKPENPSERYGDIQQIEDSVLTKFSFEDDLISIIIFSDVSHFRFKLTNKSQNSIKIIWDDAAFVDCNGSTSKVIHSGIKYSQKESPQPATTIIRGASLEDIACPSSKVRYSDFLENWTVDPMYPDLAFKEVKQVRLMLPIQIKDVVNEYVFVFNVEYVYKHPERLNLN